MWTKLSASLQSIGLWLPHFDGSNGTRKKRSKGRLRNSTSLGMLNQRHLAVNSQSTRHCQSTENIQKITANPPPSPAPMQHKYQGELKKRRSLFSFRSTYGRYDLNSTPLNQLVDSLPRSTTVDVCVDQFTHEDVVNRNEFPTDLIQSWHADRTSDTPSNPLFRLNLMKRFSSRSRSKNTTHNANNNCTDNQVPKNYRRSVSPAAIRDHSMDRFRVRRVRPRSAHFNPGAILPVKKDSLPTMDVNDLYRRIAKLGEGSYATVYKSESIMGGCLVALKEIRLQPEEGLPFTAIREASLLKGLRHANIVLLHDIIHDQTCLTFVFEYMESDLSKYLELHPSGIHVHNVRLFLYQLLRGLAFCHDQKILHRDLKPQNLLINSTGELKLADFGLARAKSVPTKTYSHEVVTLWYRPPDVLLGSTNYSTPLDMWGVGCIFAEMIIGSALFPGTKDIYDQLDRIFGIIGTPNEINWPGVSKLPNFYSDFFPPYPHLKWAQVHDNLSRLEIGLQLLTALLKLNPKCRISAGDAMMHAYFNDLPPRVHILPHISSIFILPEIKPKPEPPEAVL